jgi:hypothetical protein
MTQEGLARSVRPSWSLSAEAVQVPLQLRGSLCGIIREATRACFCPEGTFPPSAAFCISLIHPVPLGLTEALLQLGASGLAALRQQVLVGPIEIRIGLDDRAI